MTIVERLTHTKRHTIDIYKVIVKAAIGLHLLKHKTDGNTNSYLYFRISNTFGINSGQKLDSFLTSTLTRIGCLLIKASTSTVLPSQRFAKIQPIVYPTSQLKSLFFLPIE